MGIQKQNIRALDDWKGKKREHEEQRAGIGRAPVDKDLPKPRTHWQKPYERESPARRERRPPVIRRVSTLTASANPGMSAPRYNGRGRETLFSFSQTIICDVCHARGDEEARTCREGPRGTQGNSCVNCRGSSKRKCRWYGELRYDHGLRAFYEGRDRPAPQLYRKTPKTIVSQEFDGSRQDITARRNASASNAVDVEREKLKRLASVMTQLLDSAQQLLDEIEVNNSLVG